MSHYHTDEEVRNYDIFKGVVTALLLVTLFLSGMLRAVSDGDAGAPASDAASVAETDVETGTEGYPAADEVAGTGSEGYPAADEAAGTGSEGYPAADEVAAGSQITAPTLLSPPPESEPEPGPQTFSGMGTAGTEVVILAGGAELGRTAVSENGTWELEVDLPDGVESIQLQALDSDGTLAAASGDIYMTALPAQADEAYPGDAAQDEAGQVDAGEETPSEPPAVAQPGSPSPAFNPLTGSIALEGASAPGARVAAIIDDEVVDQVTAGADGQWLLNLDLDPGAYNLAFGQLDEDGNVTSRSEPVALDVPAQLPQLDLPDYSLPDEALAAIAGEESAAGDAETESDAAPERDILDSIALPQIKLPAGLVEWTGSAAPGAEVAVVVDGEVAGTATAGEDGRFTLAGQLAAGISALQLGLLGEDGELAARSKEIAVAVADMELPTIQVPEFSVDDETIAVSGTAAPGSTVEITAGGEIVAQAITGADGAWAASLAPITESVRLRVQALGEDGLPALQSSPLSLPAAAAAQPEEIDIAESFADNIVEASEAAGNFSIMLEGLEQAGLTAALSDPQSEFTLFAPSDMAFESLPGGIIAGWDANPEEYTALLSSLVVSGSYPPQELSDGLVLRTITGSDIGITRDGNTIIVNGIPIVDVQRAGSSIVYALPQFVLPPLPAGISVPEIDSSGVPVFDGEDLTVVGRGEPGERIILVINGKRFGGIATADQNGFWLISGKIDPGTHSIVALMIDDRGLLQAISREVVLEVE